MIGDDTRTSEIFQSQPFTASFAVASALLGQNGREPVATAM